MRCYISVVCALSVLAAVSFAAPMNLNQQIATLSEQENPLISVEGNAESTSLAGRFTRNIQLLRQFCPQLFQVIDNVIQNVTSQIFRVVGRVILQSGGLGGGGNGNGGGESRVSVVLPTFPPDEDDEDEDEDEEVADNAQVQSTTADVEDLDIRVLDVRRNLTNNNNAPNQIALSVNEISNTDSPLFTDNEIVGNDERSQNIAVSGASDDGGDDGGVSTNLESRFADIIPTVGETTTESVTTENSSRTEDQTQTSETPDENNAELVSVVAEIISTTETPKQTNVESVTINAELLSTTEATTTTTANIESNIIVTDSAEITQTESNLLVENPVTKAGVDAIVKGVIEVTFDTTPASTIDAASGIDLAEHGIETSTKDALTTTETLPTLELKVIQNGEIINTIPLFNEIVDDTTERGASGFYTSPRSENSIRSRRVVREAEDDQDAAASGGNGPDPADDLSNVDAEDADRDKRYLPFGGGDAHATGGGSGNFLFDIIRQTADGAARAAGTVYRMVAGTESLGLGLTATSTATRTVDASAPQLIAGSGATEESDEKENAPVAGAGGVAEVDIAKAGDGYTEGIPGPITRLFVIANRGLANLVQDLILRLAQTSERIVNFKARLITALI